ncbi:MAG: hypothetical protein DRG58_05400 [Deltaproteobacteria bacterium]|nr:MAG: hypothetical protein DRG58_05400 [Deltaproteobacteria bacterium]
MSPTEVNPRPPAYIPYQDLALVPILHGRLECALLVRQAFAQYQPQALAVELPPTVQAAVLRAVARLPLLSVVYYEESDGRLVYFPIEPTDPLIEALRLAQEHNLPVYFIDREVEGYPRLREALPDPYALTQIGLPAYAEAYRQSCPGLNANWPDLLREQAMAYHLRELQKRYARLSVVFGLAHYPGLLEQLTRPQAHPLEKRKRSGVMLAHLAEESSREILSEIPYLAAAYEQARPEIPPVKLDRLQLHQQLITEAVVRYQKNQGDPVSPTQQALLHQFARNYALIQGHLTPDFYQLVVAARGVADDDFAYEVWDLGATYPWQCQDPGLPVIRLKGEDLFLNQKPIRFQRRFRQTRRRLLPMPVRTRPREDRPGQWRQAWRGTGICSYPPEDLVVEDFGDFARKKAMHTLSEQNRRVEPFTTSLLDGIAVRETIRNWHERVIYVLEERRVPGKVGAVVIIFDPDIGPEEKYPWRVTWLGEHSQESDMAFYATPAGEHLVGPGISRCRYGGFMLSYPPWRLYEIWQDAFFGMARSKAERLVLAALDYSLEKHVAYIAAQPPRRRWLNWATRYGKKLVYLPLGSFSPVTLKKIQVFHVLDGQPVRGWARDYIW